MDFVKNLSNRVKVNLFAIVFTLSTFICNYIFNIEMSKVYFQSLGLLFIFFIILVNYFLKFFNDPVQEIIRSIQYYYNYNEFKKVDYPAKDEFGQLVKIFNGFLENIERNQFINKYLANLLSAITQKENEQEIYNEIVKGAKELFDVKYVALSIFEKNQHKVKEFYQLGMSNVDIQKIGKYPEGKGLLGYIQETKKLLRLDKISEHPRSYGFPANHPPMETLLAAPIVVGSKSYGNLYMCEKNNGEKFNLNDEILFKFYSQLAGFIIAQKLSQKEIIAIYENLENDIKRDVIEVNKIANGDLTVYFHQDSDFEFINKLNNNLNNMIYKLNDLMHHFEKSLYSTISAAQEIAASTNQLESTSQMQTQQSMSIAAGVEEVAKTIMENSQNALSAVEAAKVAGKEAEEGNKIVMQTISGMNKVSQMVIQTANNIEELGKSSNQIGEIVQVIEEIADQTNLLALNAAIEAARAGEQGRGFAVVADEVRKLAERTGKATKEIASMIKKIQKDTEDAVTAMRQGTAEVEIGVTYANQAGVALKKINEETQKVLNLINQVAIASEEQAKATNDASKYLEQIKEGTTYTFEGIKQISLAIDDLNRLMHNIGEQMSYFKLK
ncbi:MAG TPA: methyl-accepting chemotaxis protein [Ignavibacteriales bacterium]|nr:methyl-accepting chemotaxis protein [Ignavibacteriales bacterium]